MKKLLVVIFILCSYIIRAQSPIPAYIVQDTGILAAYTGTNFLAMVKDTPTCGFYYFTAGTFIKNGKNVTSNKPGGGFWQKKAELIGGANTPTWEQTLDVLTGELIRHTHSIQLDTNYFEFSGQLGGITLKPMFALRGNTNQVYFNNVPYIFPSTQGAASSALINNGSGTLSWGSAGQNIMNADLTQDANHTQTLNDKDQTWLGNDGGGNTSSLFFNYSGFQVNAIDVTNRNFFNVTPQIIYLGDSIHGGGVINKVTYDATSPLRLFGLGNDGFNHYYDPTAAVGGAFWSLASGGTLTGTNTITSNVANRLNWTGAFTTTANGQYWDKQNPSVTLRAVVGDTAYNKFLGISYTQGANTQYRVNLNLEQADNSGAFSGGQLISLQFDRDLMPKVTNQSNLGTTAKYLSSGYIANEYSDNIKFLNNGYLAFKNSGSVDVMRLMGGSTPTSLQIATFGHFDVTSNGYLLEVKGGSKTYGSVTISGLATPAAPAVANVGTTGATTYTYKIVGRTTSGSVSAASSATSTTTGNATLTGSNYNVITWTEVVGYDLYDIYRTAGGATQGKIGTFTVNSFNTFEFNDVGSAGDGLTAPTINTTGQLTVGTKNGIVGVTTNNDADAGTIGEYSSSLIAVGSATSLTTTVAKNVTSISLTAGDWDVEGTVSFTEGTATVSARSAGLSSTSATLPTDGSEAYCGVQSTLVTEINSIALVSKRFSLAGTTTIYLVGSATFSAGTCAGFGNITARRVR